MNSAADPDKAPQRVLIVGCGNIAGGFDENRPADDLPHTHAGAYIRDGRFSLSACIEPDDERRNRFMALWEISEGFRSIEEALDAGHRFDVVSICSPTNRHRYDLEASLKLKPRLIFCEKPISISLAEAEALVAQCDQENVPLAVNYTRRWDPSIAKLRADMVAAKWGKLRMVNGLYNKGVLNNGSHMIDLLGLLIGSMKIIEVGKPVFDYFPGDPTVPAWLEAGEVPVHLGCGHAEDYTLFELQLIFSEAVLYMEEGGLFWSIRPVVDSTTFKGYRSLAEGLRVDGEYPGSMLGAVNNIYQAVVHGDALASTGETALESQRTCEQIRDMALT